MYKVVIPLFCRFNQPVNSMAYKYIFHAQLKCSLSIIDILPDVFVHIHALVCDRLVIGCEAECLKATLDACSLSFLILSLLCSLASFLSGFSLFLPFLVSFSYHSFLFLLQSLALRFLFLDFCSVVVVDLYLFEESQARAFRLVHPDAWQGRADLG